MNKRMFRTLLALIFSAAAFSQGGVGCGPASGGATSGTVCSPAPSPTCCDYTLLSCQIAVRNCGSTANCAALICPTMSVIPSRPVRPSQQLTNPTKSAIPSRSAYPVRSANPSTSASVKPTMSAYPPRSSLPSASASGTVKQIYPSFTSTSTSTLTPRQVDPMVSATSTPRQADVSASATNKQADPSPTSTFRQADVSASATMTNKQVDPSATATYKQADPSTSATATVKQVDPSTSSTATMTNKQTNPTVTPKPAQSPKPSIYPRQTFNLLFQNSNNTLIRSSPKLQQLQTALACVVQIPLENIDITTISAGSTSVPFTKPQGSGAPNCTVAPRRLYSRRLQATAIDTTVSFDLLNASYVSPSTFQNDPTILSFASSVGSSGKATSYPEGVPTPNGTRVGIILGVLGGCVVVAFGIVYIRSYLKRRPVSHSRLLTKTQTRINPLASSNNKISYSPAVVKISRSNSV